MKISGKKVAEEIRLELKTRIEKLKTRNIIPRIAILTLGDEGAWEFYVRQKIKIAEELGIDAVFIPLKDANEIELLNKIEEINNDASYHGMIVQRPMPDIFNKKTVTDAIAPSKDIDGFQENSKFEVPVWLAAKKLTEVSFKELGINSPWSNFSFVVIGKGETAGGPTIKGLRALGVEAKVIDSKTSNPDEILKSADVIISCAGRNIVNANNIKPGVILIGVGTRGEDGKLKGDYNSEEIENIAASFTPTPGGVGPVNLTYLFKNLIDACEK